MAQFPTKTTNPDGFNFGNDAEEVDVSSVDKDLDAISILVVGTAGDLEITTAKGNKIVLPSSVVSVLGVVPIFCTKVWTANTTATEIWAIKP